MDELWKKIQTRRIYNINRLNALKTAKTEKELELVVDGYQLDLFSTFLSRKVSRHVCIGQRRWVKAI